MFFCFARRIALDEHISDELTAFPFEFLLTAFVTTFVTITDNIIMWREVDANGGMGLDYALSFQEATGCTAIW